jgi:hypothetical protein
MTQITTANSEICMSLCFDSKPTIEDSQLKCLGISDYKYEIVATKS